MLTQKHLFLARSLGSVQTTFTTAGFITKDAGKNACKDPRPTKTSIAFRSPMRSGSILPGSPTTIASGSSSPRTSTPSKPQRSTVVSRPFKSPFRSPAATAALKHPGITLPKVRAMAMTRPSSTGEGQDPEAARLTGELKDLEDAIRDVDDRKRKVRMVKGYQVNDEITKVDALVRKWRLAARLMLTSLRDAIGPLPPIGGNAPPSMSFGWGYDDPPPPRSLRQFEDDEGDDQRTRVEEEMGMPEEPRMPTLGELCERMRVDVASFGGTYDVDMDEFFD
ncbi:hypothetical protein HKX48_001947 [Thoreauomyces humboldtii]|nr:hypothetical protein HKX48_001947 [Thoreauomyces humboldtii]